MSYGRLPLFIIVIGRIGVAIAAIITVRISTSILTPFEMGSITELNSIVSLFSLLLVIPITHFMNRGFLEWNDSGKLSQNIRKYIIYLLFISAIAFFLSGTLQYFYRVVTGFSFFWVAILVGLITLLQPLYNLAVAGLNLFSERGKFVFFSNLVAWTTLLFSVVGYKWQKNIVSWSFGQVISFLLGLSAFYFLRKIIRKSKSAPNSQDSNTIHFTIQTIYKFSWPILVTSALWWMQSNSYRFILDRVQGTANVGLFVTAYALAAAPIAIYESIISQYLEPIFFSDLKNQNRTGQVKAWNNYARFYLPGLILTGLFVISATPFLARVLLGNELYREAAFKITVWAAVIETMRATGSLMFHLGIAKADNRMTIIPVAAGAILAPLGVFIFGKWDPLLGTIAGLMLASTVVLTIIIVLSSKVLPISWPIKRVIYVLFIAIPLISGLVLAQFLFPKPDFFNALLILIVSGSYTCLVLALLLKKTD
jgi:hypothetical protein